MKFTFILLLALFLNACCNAELIYVDAPKKDQEIVYNYVRKILQPDTAFSNNLHRADFKIEAPFREYFVEPGDVAAGRLLSATKSGAWQFLVFRGTNVIGIAYCMFDPKSGKPRASVEFSTIAYPMEPVTMAEQLPQIKQQDYEVRLFGASIFRGLWLHAKSNDIFIPANDGFGKLQALRPYSEVQLIKILKPEEERNVAMCEKLNKQEQKRDTVYLKAMMDYEKAHGGKCGAITNFTASFQDAGSPGIWVGILNGKSSKGGILAYKVEVTCKDEPLSFVKRVKILERITDNRP